MRTIRLLRGGGRSGWRDRLDETALRDVRGVGDDRPRLGVRDISCRRSFEADAAAIAVGFGGAVRDSDENGRRPRNARVGGDSYGRGRQRRRGEDPGVLRRSKSRRERPSRTATSSGSTDGVFATAPFGAACRGRNRARRRARFKRGVDGKGRRQGRPGVRCHCSTRRTVPRVAHGCGSRNEAI